MEEETEEPNKKCKNTPEQLRSIVRLFEEMENRSLLSGNGRNSQTNENG